MLYHVEPHCKKEIKKFLSKDPGAGPYIEESLVTFESQELGELMKAGTVSKVGDLYELRLTVGPGKIGRFLFAMKRGPAVLLHFFPKHSQKILRKDLQTARRRAKNI